MQRLLRLLPLSIPPKICRACKKTASAETREPRACGGGGTSASLCSLSRGPEPGAVAGRAPCCCGASTPSPSPVSSVINTLPVLHAATRARGLILLEGTLTFCLLSFFFARNCLRLERCLHLPFPVLSALMLTCGSPARAAALPASIQTTGLPWERWAQVVVSPVLLAGLAARA